jgi:hypothetical protein
VVSDSLAWWDVTLLVLHGGEPEQLRWGACSRRQPTGDLGESVRECVRGGSLCLIWCDCNVKQGKDD